MLFVRPARRLAAFLAFVLLLVSTAASALAEVRVVDGDTLVVDGTHMRLWGIDAPESAQQCSRDGAAYACGRDATAHLSELIGGRNVACEPRTTDRYRRTVAVCRVGGVDLGAAMVRDGWAMAFVRYSSDYVPQEQEARAARRGLWSGTFEFPWDWRRTHARPR